MTAALLLDGEVVCYEADSDPGGHCRAIVRDGWTFDQGPHIMFSRDQELLSFMIDSLGDNVHRSKRNNVVMIEGRTVRYPIENDLGSLPTELRNACTLDFFFNEDATLKDSPANLDEWFRANFGRALTSAYFKPYNEKIWNVSLAELSMSWSERIPQPPAKDVLIGALGVPTEGYLHQLYFHYPERGGYSALTDAWAKLLPDGVLRLSDPVHSLRRDGDGVVLESASGTERFDRVVSTATMPQLVSMLGGAPAEVVDAVNALRINPVVIVTLGIEGVDEEQYTAAYFPDPAFLVNRASFPCVISPFNGPEGAYSIQAEITYPPGSSYRELDDEALIDHVTEGFTRHGLLKPGQRIVFTDVQRIEHAYVVYTVGYERNVEVVRAWAAQHGVELHGRFGAFEYLNVDGCIAQSLKLATRLNGRETVLSEIDLGARAGVAR